jgi:cytosine/adenosine deaminase-related metal-dependent hydrolase
MCKLCDEGIPQSHSTSRRDFLKATAATGAAAASLNLFAARPAAADGGDPPEDHGRRGRRYIIRGGSVMSMDPNVGDFAQADVLVEGKQILAVGPNLHAGDADVIDARGRVVMPGFIDTHHHQFETALRSFLADGILINDHSNTPSGNITYYEYILLTFAPVYRPQDVYINELFGGLSQLDDGVTTVHDISQIHHSPQHSDAAIQGLMEAGRRAAFGYFEGAGLTHGPQYAYPQDAVRIKKQWFSSSDQLVSMIMGGEVYLGAPTYTQSWHIGRQLGLQVAAHILSPFGIRPIMDLLARGKGGVNGDIGLGPDNLFIHMTGMSDMSWQAVKDAGVHVSLAVPIEMNMRHGMPPILKTLSLGIQPSLSSDVEVTMTADFFTQMRSTMNIQRALVNQTILEPQLGIVDWPAPPPPGTPDLLTTRDVLRFATINGAKDLRLDEKTGSLTPGKEADIIILDATAINVAPLNQVPGAVVSLMDRTNVETVIVAGKVRKWKGKLLDVDLPHLRQQLEASRDYIFAAAGIKQDLFRSN